uniref:Uncharacterized protein n=1 Tax=Ochrobactrum phage ORM_20 TaxID=2985243 RepID=A0A9N6WTT8_9VIRU|nr:hypothetical protein ORM20_00201 [Ochrobactrum phage ORM_20]
MTIFEDENDIVVLYVDPKKIPHGSVVSKGPETYKYTLVKKIKVWPTDRDRKEGAKSLVVEGIFLEGRDGNYNQVPEDKKIFWHIDVSTLYSIIGDDLEDRD